MSYWDLGVNTWAGLARQYGPSPHVVQFQSFCWNCQGGESSLLLQRCQNIGLELLAALLLSPVESQVEREADSEESRTACGKLYFGGSILRQPTATYSFLKKFYWSIFDLQCCVSFRCTAKWFSYTYFFRFFFPTKVIAEYSVEFPVLYSRSLLVICFIYSSMCMLIPSSWFPGDLEANIYVYFSIIGASVLYSVHIILQGSLVFLHVFWAHILTAFVPGCLSKNICIANIFGRWR